PHPPLSLGVHQFRYEPAIQVGVDQADVAHHRVGVVEHAGVQLLQHVLAGRCVDEERVIDVAFAEPACRTDLIDEAGGDRDGVVVDSHASAARTMDTSSAYVMPMHGSSHGMTRSRTPDVANCAATSGSSTSPVPPRARNR